MNYKLTYILSYYNQKEALKYHINTWNSYSNELKKQIHFQIVDDCSLKHPAKPILDDLDISSLNLSLYHVKDDLYCNIAGVRNLGAKEASTPWLIILDMDTVVSSVMASQLIDTINKHPKDAHIVYKFNRKVINNPSHIKNNQPHPAICLIRKSDYWYIGGCEEDFVGHYGQTDPSFWYKAKNKVMIFICKNIYLDYLVEGEADIIRDTAHNKKLFELKKINNSWSKDYIRFNWEKLL